MLLGQDFIKWIEDVWNVLSGAWLLVSWTFFLTVIQQAQVPSGLEREDISACSQTDAGVLP